MSVSYPIIHSYSMIKDNLPFSSGKYMFQAYPDTLTAYNTLFGGLSSIYNGVPFLPIAVSHTDHADFYSLSSFQDLFICLFILFLFMFFIHFYFFLFAFCLLDIFPHDVRESSSNISRRGLLCFFSCYYASLPLLLLLLHRFGSMLPKPL
jgi:hypothetical protein